MKESQTSSIKEAVKEHYADLISKRKKEGAGCGCGPSPSTQTSEKLESSCCSPDLTSIATSKTSVAELIGYDKTDISEIPDEAVQNAFGCGVPLTHVDIKEGDVVLDLGSGAGLDILLTSRKVGSTGKAIGLDMTPEMIEKANENAQKMGAQNVEFRLGEMEDMPIEDNSVDWIISNCVINLSPDKLKVFSEAYRVLKTGGKMVVSDIIAKDLSEELKQDFAFWAGCIGGALSEKDYLQAIRDAGFREVEVLSKVFLEEELSTQLGQNLYGKIASVKVRAIKEND
jgi:ubiquinone/menaquinone biosynthesis C-methylase UbiE